MNADARNKSLLQRIVRAPRPFDPARAERTLEDLRAHPAAAKALNDPKAAALLAGAAGNSPYLARLMRRAPEVAAAALARPPELAVEDAIAALARAVKSASSMDEMMAAIRKAKRDAALTIALADIAGVWGWEDVTRAITALADACVREALRFLLLEDAAAGRFHPRDAREPDRKSGLIVLAMGKHGAGELNYSSDIDIVVFFDREVLPLAKDQDPSKYCIRLVQRLVRAVQEPTGDGYGFRVDLRLRPDAGATQVALSTEAAELYYESMGQNWERAAMIKARPCAGDTAAGEAFLKHLQPFVFRKYLDFAAIEDIHSIKRQIHAHGGHGVVAIEGHNVKLGRGGIREIEFFVQTQQLILGGRDAALRGRATIAMLNALVARGTVRANVARELTEAYAFLRTVEHRLQMIEDEQTHTLSETAEGIAHAAAFMGFDAPEAFRAALRGHLERVSAHYAALFESAPPLSEKRGSLVFTGVDDDPETIATLKRLGFSRPSDVAAAIRGWHHGRVRAMRSERARERLTALTPALLDALAATANPDRAFAGFDRFLAGLPAGVQVFSLLFANPSLLGVLADAFGTAPRLAAHLGRYPALLDALLDVDFLQHVPARAELDASLRHALSEAEGFEDVLDRVRRWQKEQMLRIALQVIRGRIEAAKAGVAFTALAECVIAGLLAPVRDDMTRTHGIVPGGHMTVLALGKLGGREMTAGSDLDLIVVYDAGDDAMSNGERPLAASHYFARMTQRLISALTALTAEGGLYEVDMRLRPSGTKGPVATRIDSFIAYHEHEAWTWERMALTRARVIAGDAALAKRVEAVVAKALTAPRDEKATAADIADMRTRIAKEYPGKSEWDLKYGAGGLVDLEFTVQALLLRHAGRHPKILEPNVAGAIEHLRAANLIDSGTTQRLLQGAALLHAVTQVLRIALDGPFEPENAGPGLHALIARVCEARDFTHASERMAAARKGVRAAFEAVVGIGT